MPDIEFSKPSMQITSGLLSPVTRIQGSGEIFSWAPPWTPLSSEECAAFPSDKVKILPVMTCVGIVSIFITTREHRDPHFGVAQNGTVPR
jgi:hypothetical protein